MEYRYLGNTSLRVSPICLGTMTFGPSEARPNQLDEAGSHAILDAFIEAGGNFIDTADVYQMGVSEEILGSWLAKQDRRDKIIVATKLFGAMRDDDPNCKGLSRHHILTNVEESLKRLQTSYIDLLYVHIWDDATPIEETLRTLTGLVRTGKVHYLGASNFTGWQVQLAASTSKQLGLEHFSCLQQQYSLLSRHIEWEVTEVCRREGVAILPWSPLKGGWLSGKMRRDQGAAPEGSRVHHVDTKGIKPNEASPTYEQFANQEQTWRILETCEEIARREECSVAQVAIRWLLQKRNVPSVVIGATSLSQLKDNLGAVTLRLSDDDMDKLDKASAIPTPYPYEMIHRLTRKRVD